MAGHTIKIKKINQVRHNFSSNILSIYIMKEIFVPT